MPVPDVPGQASSEHRNSDRFRGQDKCWDNDNQTGLRPRGAPWAGRRLQTPYVRTVGCSYPRSVHTTALPGRGVDKGRGKARASSGRGVESKRWSALISTRRRGTIRRIRTKSRRDRRAVVIQRGRVLTDAGDLGLCVHVDVALDSRGGPLDVPAARWEVVQAWVDVGQSDLLSAREAVWVEVRCSKALEKFRSTSVGSFWLFECTSSVRRVTVRIHRRRPNEARLSPGRQCVKYLDRFTE